MKYKTVLQFTFVILMMAVLLFIAKLSSPIVGMSEEYILVLILMGLSLSMLFGGGNESE